MIHESREGLLAVLNLVLLLIKSQVIAEVCCRLVALIQIPIQAAAEDLLEFLITGQFIDLRLNVQRENIREYLLTALSGKEFLQREHLIEKESRRKQVCADISRMTINKLWSKITELAFELLLFPVLTGNGVNISIGNAKIQELDLSGIGKKDVSGIKVPMDNGGTGTIRPHQVVNIVQPGEQRAADIED